MKIPKDETKTTTIKEALSFPEGTPIQRLVGKVNLVWPRTTGEGKWGTWFKQSGLIEDDSGNKMVFTVWDKPDISEYKGRKVVFRTSPGSKKPSIALKADYKDASKMTLNVGKSSIVLTEDEELDDIPMNHDESGAPMAEQKNHKPSEPAKPSAPSNSVQEVKKRLMQLANLRHLCDNAAGYLDPEADPMIIKDISSCLFIQACRENLMDKMPNNKPLSDHQEKPDSRHPEALESTGDKDLF